MFEEEGNQLALEVKFIEAYQSLLKKLKCCVESNQIDSEQMVSALPGKRMSTLEVRINVFILMYKAINFRYCIKYSSCI
jgi:hypothetical protein